MGKVLRNQLWQNRKTGKIRRASLTIKQAEMHDFVPYEEPKPINLNDIDTGEDKKSESVKQPESKPEDKTEDEPKKKAPAKAKTTRRKPGPKSKK